MSTVSFKTDAILKPTKTLIFLRKNMKKKKLLHPAITDPRVIEIHLNRIKNSGTYKSFSIVATLEILCYCGVEHWLLTLRISDIS